MNQLTKISFTCVLSLHLISGGCNFNAKKTVAICDSPPISVDTRFPNRAQDTAFETVSNISFTSEDEITLSGWVRKEQKLKSDADISTFRSIRVDTTGNQTVIINDALQPISVLKCSGNCVQTAFAESPNHKWQLATVYPATSTHSELWLLGKNQQIQISKFTPYDLRWEWSKDGDILWLTHAGIESGRDSLLIWLDELPKSVDSSSNSQINPTSHRISFSPTNKDFLLAGSNKNYLANGELQRIDLLSKSLNTTSLVTVSNTLIDIFWNPSSSEHILVFVESNGLSFKSENGQEVLRLSKENFDDLFGKTGMAIRNYFSSSSLFAVSKSQAKLAIHLDKLDIFTCKS
jgi:hypothetical protein